MKRDFLKELGLEEDAIDRIMAENGKDIEKEKSKFADYDDIKKQRDDANAKIASFGDVEAIKAEVDKWKTEAEKAKADSDAKIKKMEKSQQVKDFTSTKKFVNDRTRKSINQQLEEELDKEESKGKSLEEIFEALTKDEKDILVAEAKPQPPVIPNMTDDKKTDNNDAQIRAIMGLPPKKD